MSKLLRINDVQHGLGRPMRMLAVVLCLSFSQGLFAQDKDYAKIEAAMQEAMERGRNPDEPYVCMIEKKKIPVSSVKSYIYIQRKKGCDYFFGDVHYIYKKNSSKNSHAGDFIFWKKSDYDDFVFRHLLPDGLSVSDLSKVGEGFVFFEDGKIRYNDFAPDDIMTASGTYKDIRWSGNIDENGFIDGEGTGVLISEWVGFSGKFVNGFPQGDVTYRYFKERGGFIKYEILPRTFRVGKLNGEWASFTYEGARAFQKGVEYQVNRSGRITYGQEYIKKQNEQKELARQRDSLNQMKRAFAARQKLGDYDLLSPEISYEFLKNLRYILSDQKNRENKDITDKLSLSLASKMANPVGMPASLWELADILKNNPQIANAKDIFLTWDGSRKVNMKDVFYDYVYNHCWPPRERVLYIYNYVYGDWGKMTEEEIKLTENNFVLTLKPEYFKSQYQQYFPNGRYAGKDYKEAWVLAYIDFAKNMLKKNDANMWLDRKDYPKEVSLYDWLHYPRLSKSIGAYSESTSVSTIMGAIKKAPKQLLFNNRVLSFLESLFSKTEYVFKNYESQDHKINYWAYNQMGEGKIYDEARKYRSLLDAIGAAAIVDENTGVNIGVTLYGRNMVRWIACHELVDYFYDGVKAARELSSTTPEIRPACKKAEEFIKQKFLLLKKDVFDKTDAIWEAAIQEYNAGAMAAQQANEDILREVENMGLPKYEYVESEWQRTVDDRELSRNVRFRDLTGEITDNDWVDHAEIVKATDGSYYKAVGGAFIRTKYKTERDAIIATYAYLKYGVIRQKGQL